MSSSPDEIIAAALQLSEAERLRIAARLLDTLPEGELGLSEDDPDFHAELNRRAKDPEATVPVSELWKQD